MFRTISDLFKKHEWLVVTGLMVVILTFNYSHLLDYLQQRALANETKAQLALQEQRQANRQLAVTAAEAEQHYQSMMEQLMAANASLAANQAKRTIQVQVQQAADRTLPPDQLAQRWTELIRQNADSIVPTDSGYQVSATSGVETVIALETIPQLYGDLQDEKEIAANIDSERQAAVNVNAALDDQLAGMKAEITKQDKACKAEIAVVKAQARKSKSRWFFIGVIAGAIARNVAGL